MKTLKIFGYTFSLDLRKSVREDIDEFSPLAILREKTIYLVLLMFIFGIASEVVNVYNSNNYKVGDVVLSDIYAPQTIVYRDVQAKEDIIKEIIDSTPNEYLYVKDRESLYLGYLENFFDEISQLKSGKIKTIDVSKWEENLGKSMPQTLIDEIVALPSRTISSTKTACVEFLHKAYESGVYEERSGRRIDQPLEEEIEKMRPIQKSIVNLFLAPNHVINVEDTRKMVHAQVSQIKNQYVTIKAGDVIAEKGEVLDRRKMDILEQSNIYSFKKSIFYLVLNGIYLTILSIVFYVIMTALYRDQLLSKKIYRSLFFVNILFFAMYFILHGRFLYLIPGECALYLMTFVTNGLLHTTRTGSANNRMPLAMYPVMMAFLMPMLNFNLPYLLVYGISFPIGSYLIRRVSTRSDIISIGVKIATLRVILFFTLSFFLTNISDNIFRDAFYIMVAGILTGTLTVALIPYFEKTFNIVTIFRLQELGDLSNPLLKRLATEAAGTFNHSTMVAHLAEEACAELGLNSIFARVASYYHDIGKLKNPRYFTENQENGVNLHEGKSPFLSRTIILSHVRDGVELGRKYRLPLEVRNIMKEHHGTTFIAYFYNLAKSQDPNVREEEFTYPGPKPQSKESAVIMLADSVEAAVRSITNKTPKNIEEKIDELVASKLEGNNQLSESPITFDELEKIKSSFLSTLLGAYHSRVKYPGQQD